MHNGIIPESPWIVLQNSLIRIYLNWFFNWQTNIRLSDARQSFNFQRKYRPLEENSGDNQSARRYCIVQCEFQYDFIPRFSWSETHQHCRHKFDLRSSTVRRRGTSDAIVECAIWLADAAVLWCRLQSQHGVIHRPAGTRLSEGTKDAEGGGGRPSDVPSEIAYAAIGGEVATLPTVLGHHRDHRRHLEHHLEEGKHRWGSSRHACAPCATFAPLAREAASRRNAWGTRTEVRSRTRFRDGLR